jgi:broad specificity phosphatase PhoE
MTVRTRLLFRILALVCFSVALIRSAAGEEPAAIYIVRHAEKAVNVPGFQFSNTATPLTAAGMQRALDLRERLRDVELTAVFSTQTVRTFETATPTAAAAKLEVTPYQSLSNTLINVWKAHLAAGRSILIVSHAGMVERIVERLTGQHVAPALGGRDFDNLFIVTRHHETAKVARRNYGAFKSLGMVELTGELLTDDEFKDHIENFSAVEVMGEFLLIGPDEGTETLVFKEDGNRYEVIAPIALDDPAEDEIDIEGISRDGNTVYVIGSHSWRRKNIFSKKRRVFSERRIREVFEDENESPDREKNRERLFQFELDPTTGGLVPNSKKETDLNAALTGTDNDVLKPFRSIPSKENGVDIEGLAFRDGYLFAGLRGPVLRFSYVPVLVFKFDEPEKAKVRYVQLNGNGIRAMVRTGQEFLIVAGPVGDGPGGYSLYHWDGEDCFPGEQRAGRVAPLGTTTLLGRIPTPPNAKAEGLTILRDAGDYYEVLVVHDGPKKGQPQKLRVYKLD